ncbi:MAG: WecB/TagA/CpsF family glycosyltransferase [Ignavibacteriales bacterium]|nr:WecB/TagA/CpsF family glycosyltransferase [Ignavibacteriales bacterium]
MATVVDREKVLSDVFTESTHSIERRSKKQTQQVRFQLRSFYLMGTRVDNIDSDLALRIVRHYAVDHGADRARKIFFTNVHSICSAQQNEILKQCINLGDLVLPDGSGLRIGGKMTGNPIIENLNGTDFTPKVLRMAEDEGLSLFFFGAEEPVVQQCCNRIRNAYPKLRIAGYRNGYFQESEDKNIVEQINAARPDILLVALGTPKQEIWLTRYSHDLNVNVAMAVGGLFDFLSMTKKRAPLWMRRLGIEWLFRFLHEPKAKWKRIIIEIPMYFSMLFAKKYVPASFQRTLRKAIFS